MSSKYRNVRTRVDGISFHSKREAARYLELKMLLKAKKIKNLRLQVRFPLMVNETKVGHYIADFTYNHAECYPRWGAYVIEDVKGVKTAVYSLKKKILAANGISISEV